MYNNIFLNTRYTLNIYFIANPGKYDVLSIFQRNTNTEEWAREASQTPETWRKRRRARSSISRTGWMRERCVVS